MSLANLLFKKNSADSELDNIFKAGSSKPAVPLAPAPASASSASSKRKPAPVEDAEQAKPISRKRAKHDKSATKRVTEPASSDDEPAPPESKKKAARSDKDRKKRVPSESDDEAPAPAPAPAPVASSNDANDSLQPSSDPDDSSDDDADAPPPQHISLTSGTAGQSSSKSKSKKSKFTPSDETADQRDARTVFIGNLPIDVAKNKSARKQLIRHLSSFVPNSSIESIRFRSVAFLNPTSELPKSDDEDDAVQKRRKKQREDELSSKEKRGKERAAAWRDDQDQETNEGKKQFLTPAEKKKIAFIHKEFHADADTTNAYAVFAYPKPGSDAVAPNKAAELCVAKADGSTFMERTIRVDRVGAGVASAKTDARRSIFVGNLDFAAKEEDLRVFFESLLATERGPPPASEGQDHEQPRWVTHVRLVRDAATQLGKGFAYVEFADRECVDEVLALDQLRLKFAKRKLRVQKCKVNPSQSRSSSAAVAKTKGATPASASKKPILDPSHFLTAAAKKKSSTEYAARAAELAELPKDARKAAKAADEERLARRMEKKQKKRMALGAGAAEAGAGKGGKGILGKKKTSGGPGAKKPKPKLSKGRIRSEKSVAKRNAKK